ncbi:NAD+ kinase [Scopulibacillus darangshiensis]|uniref:NAD kinase n=1 Tax=Scopulibacillus darangshiensis TaxID=442528 RepID=A0A4R2PDR3_9BACL|nr:NAD kinase [Scopulibacillus darangshiensis]TCP32055.1 NAD+ kinase [Scopulibacillus darangshiensis]
MEARNKLYFFYKNTKKLHPQVEELKAFAESQDFHLVNDPAEANIITSIGGDGAFLQAVRKTGFRDDCLYLGISTGQLGFYCDFNINAHKDMLEAIRNEQIEVRKYPIIQVEIDGDTRLYCLNECSIRTSTIKVFSIEVYIDNLHFETFKGDGMIISTPTGSSGYNKSVNGAVIDPKIPCLQVSELASLNNNYYRTLGSAFVLNQERELTLKIKENINNYPIIGLDNEAYSIRSNKEIKITLPDRRIKTVKLKDNSFWHKVQRSFL